MARNIEDIIDIENGKIRRHFEQEMGENFYSIVDVVAILTKSTDPRNYWKVLKNRLKNTQNELVTECNQLKMTAADGKSYLTDTANAKTILKIIEVISPDNVATFRAWFKKAENKFSTGEESTSSNFELKEEDILAELTVDAYQTSDDIFIRAFIAGIPSSNLSISATCNELTIKGLRESPANISESNYLQQELYWGEFSRIVPLPEEIDIDAIEATEQQGFLIIKLPKLNKKLSRIVKMKSI